MNNCSKILKKMVKEKEIKKRKRDRKRKREIKVMFFFVFFVSIYITCLWKRRRKLFVSFH